MNIVFKHLHTKRFQSLDDIKLDIDDKGVVVIKGINNYEDNVKSNGSGKSSIFESIIFALYGETSNGITDPENRVLNNGYEVSLSLSIDNVDYQITRSKENGKSKVELLQYIDGVPNDISGRNKTDANKIILNLLNISKELFLDSVFLAQGVSTNLSTLSPTARKERLEILTGTEKLIEDFKSYIKERQLEYETKCTELTLNKSKIEGNIQSLNDQKNTLRAKIEEIKVEIERYKSLGNIEDIDNNIKICENEIVQIEQTIQDIEQSIAESQTKINTLKETKQSIETEKELINTKLVAQRELVYKLNSNLDNLQNNIAIHNRDIDRLNNDIEAIRNSDTCPTCGRKYDNANEEHIQQTISKYNAEINQHLADIEKINNQIAEDTNSYNLEVEVGKKLKSDYDTLQSKVQEINNLIQIEETNQTNQTNQTKNQRNFISNKQTQIKELQAKKEEILKVKVPDTTEYENMIRDIELNITNLHNDIQNIETEWNAQNDLVDTCKYSQQLITKPFRTYLLQNSINLLNEKLAYLSRKLFSNEKDIITINGDDSKLDIRLGDSSYESLSGGEKTRVNMCLLLAQKYLASNIGNIECNIIVLDEVLGQCDSEAEMNIIDLIIEELQSVSSIIFIGHKELPIPYDNLITVVKDEHGLSRLQSM